ncbi:HNH endonuclease [Mycolicibacterium vaccae]|uniref:HNH endonuclease n=1 Tax=Mycolicibacterium vaccae TaxID=1810 RepID=UPI003D088D45
MSRRTDFPPPVVEIVDERAGGRCERCGEIASDLQNHHRRPRGSGGSRRPDTNVASNAGRLCGLCHRTVESYRAKAYDEGWLVRQSQSPMATPVLYRGRWVLLDDLGDTYRIPTPTGDVAS